jgi:hypothetical protein
VNEDLKRAFGEIFIIQLQRMLVKRADYKTVPEGKAFLDRVISIRYNDCVILNLRKRADEMINVHRKIETNASFFERITKDL